MSKSSLTRRSLVKGIALGATGAAFGPSALAREPANLGISAGMLPNLNGAVYIALREKYFEKLGLDVNLIKFTSGPAQVAALAGGQAHLGWGGMGAYLIAKANGQDLQSIA